MAHFIIENSDCSIYLKSCVKLFVVVIIYTEFTHVQSFASIFLGKLVTAIAEQEYVLAPSPLQGLMWLYQFIFMILPIART